MKRISTRLILGVFPFILLLVLVVFYIIGSTITGNVFEREKGKFRPFTFSQPFTRPIDGPSIPLEGISLSDYLHLWVNGSYWAWPMNEFARSNPYIYFLVAGIITFALFVHYQVRSESYPDETKAERTKAIRKSIQTVGLGLLGEILVFSVVVYFFFSSKNVQGYVYYVN